MSQKPSYNEWKYWAEVLIDRLTTAVHIYNKPPYENAYLSDIETQPKVHYLVEFIRRVHHWANNDDLAVPTLSQSAQNHEKMVAKLTPLFADILIKFPSLAKDMQHLLKSPWFENCTGVLATELFCGPHKRLDEGLGDGTIECGRLAAALSDLMERENVGTSRDGGEDFSDDAIALRRSSAIRKKTTSYGSAGRVD